ncbi:hypothetical protein [Pseudoponticoccus marisrubri]|uniref:Uncharacterized protein n=1 Tax=Pseudoponticoccus marisrubri TaxID=1685382 RepID=A0A0W7WND4_9RHOB|nr:hypothetical protein [Pseudoponticoccus marisrubri]KUF12033.1 hypothetical protein AVJ23_05515 [Pseudoponticoccus marisrubri]
MHSLATLAGLGVAGAAVLLMRVLIPDDLAWPEGVGWAVAAVFLAGVAGFLGYFAVISRALGLRPGLRGWLVCLGLSVLVVVLWFWAAVAGLIAPGPGALAALALLFVLGGLAWSRHAKEAG